MIRSLGDRIPKLDPSVWVSEAAYVCGDVTIGAGSSVWPGAVIRGDFCTIVIGENTHIEDNCVVHGGDLCEMGDHIICGHGVVVHGRRIGSLCLLGNNATILDGAEIGDRCIVAAGALVLGNTIVPEGSFVSGVPATVVPATARQLQRLEGHRNVERGYGAMAQRYRDAGL
ncbi:MAG: gamma carbonic anhydrase family protein [Acidimicrobiia bacterium]